MNMGGSEGRVLLLPLCTSDAFRRHSQQLFLSWRYRSKDRKETVESPPFVTLLPFSFCLSSPDFLSHPALQGGCAGLGLRVAVCLPRYLPRYFVPDAFFSVQDVVLRRAGACLEVFG